MKDLLRVYLIDGRNYIVDGEFDWYDYKTVTRKPYHFSASAHAYLKSDSSVIIFIKHITSIERMPNKNVK